MKAMNLWILAAALIGSSPLAEVLASPAPVRVLRKQIELNAAVDQVFAAWTTNEGIQHFFGAEANVKLEPSPPV